MIETLTQDTFQPRIGEPFRVFVDETRYLPVVLAETTAWAKSARGPSGRIPFSVIFQSEEAGSLPQATYRVTHEALGEMELFLVPLGAEGGGMRYEALFT